MADGKWIEGLRPEMMVAEAARRVLAERFEIVCRHLPLAMHQPDADPEHVHRLRVGTRRAGAALCIFRAWLPDRARRRARRTLRGLRRAAGAARDWDVFLIELLNPRKQVRDKARPGVDFLSGYAAGQRDAAQAALLEAGTGHGPGLRDLVARTLEAIRAPEEAPDVGSLGDLGRVQLAALLGELDWAGGRRMDDYAHLHQVRILGKKFRYAMEVFADCFPEEFKDELYPRVEEMQEILGLANDSHVAEGRMAALRDRLAVKCPDEASRWKPALDALLRFHRRRLPRQREQFLQWWAGWQSTEAPRLRAMLVPPPGRKRPAMKTAGPEQGRAGEGPVHATGDLPPSRPVLPSGTPPSSNGA